MVSTLLALCVVDYIYVDEVIGFRAMVLFQVIKYMKVGPQNALTNRLYSPRILPANRIDSRCHVCAILVNNLSLSTMLVV
jgi:hypothetical protein